MNSPFVEKIQAIQEKIDKALKTAPNPHQRVLLLAVSKTKPANQIEEAFQAGQIYFGENYVQEFLSKKEELKHLPLHWHLIGHLQSRKVKEVVGQAEWIHSVDSLKIVEKINESAARLGIMQKALIQINSGLEETKSGFDEKEIFENLKKISDFPHLEILGLMSLPPFDENPEKTRPHFKKLYSLLNEINEKKIYRQKLTELSMGMSHDFPIAVEEGSTCVRVGTALFGERLL